MVFENWFDYQATTAEQVAALSGEQVGQLLHVDWLNPEAFAGFTATNIKEIKVEFFSRWLKAQQISSLTPSAFAGLTPEQLDNLSANAYKGITAQQVEALSAAQVGQLWNVDWLNPEAFAGFTDANIKKITAEYFSRWFKAEQISLLKPAAFAGLTPEQLGNLSKKAYEGITAQQVAALSAAQVEQLWHVDWLKPEAFAGFTADNIKKIKAEFFSRWLSEEQISSLTPAASAGLAPEQLRNLSANAFKGLQRARLPHYLRRWWGSLGMSTGSSLKHLLGFLPRIRHSRQPEGRRFLRG